MSRFDYDCSKCAAFCCIALGYEASDQFPHEKPKNERCKNLNECDSCSIHEDLEDQGYHGCIAFSCHGAGPHIVKLYSKIDWRNSPELTHEVYDKFHFAKAAFQIADASEMSLKKNGLNPKKLIKEFFTMVSTRQKVPMISDQQAADAFIEKWENKLRQFVVKNS